MIINILGIERFQSVQAYYSLVGGELEYEVLPAVRDLGLGVMVWSPLAGGFLSGKYTSKEGSDGRRAAFGFPSVDPDVGEKVLSVLREIAERRTATTARVALSWLLYQNGITSVIVGAKKLHQLEDNLKAVDLDLTSEDLARLEEVSRPTPLYCWQWPLRRGMVMEDMFSS